jgi:2-phosphosulfolactate phosphatase
MSFFDQNGYQVRFEWGAAAIDQLAAGVDVLIIVDILSFTTSIEIAVSRGAEVLPCAGSPDELVEFAKANNALLAATSPEEGPYSLRPSSLKVIRPRTRLVLPSLNGSTLSHMASGLGKPIAAACLRNAAAVARWASAQGGTALVVASGEQWPNGRLRPSFEDLIGAGAVIDALPANRSPEAEAARAAFIASLETLATQLLGCSSGRQLIERGSEADVLVASKLNASETVPVLRNGAFTSN